ncbi:MAG: type II toxin-antitoxin system VapC family toxin [Candidatus Bathyarchaeia archaeon]
MTLYVIDASVAARFLLTEDLSDKAGLVLENFMNGLIDLAAPGLMIYETGNTLWKAFRQGLINLEEAKDKIAHLLDLKIPLVELNRDDHEKIMEWSAKNDATYYDGAYAVASWKTGGVLLTADDILHRKAGARIPAAHLRDYGVKTF